MTDEELITRLRAYWGNDASRFAGKTLTEDAADRIEALMNAFGILEDALQEVGDDYPGSNMQEWCQQQVKAARAALKGDKT